MTDETYQGWTNRETWLVNLWLNNEEPTYRAGCKIARTHPDASDLWLGEAIQVEVLEPLAEGEDLSGFQVDMMRAAMSRVDWAAIGAAFRESVS